jgi:hypothetical protein
MSKFAAKAESFSSLERLEPKDRSYKEAGFQFIQFLRQPLLHFLIIGALIFGLYSFIGRETSTRSPLDRIEVSQPQIELLMNDWERQWRQVPDSEELQNIIDRYIRDEVFYREAKALGLDRNDIIIRRRLIQKMQFLTEDTTALPEPTDEDLQAYLNDRINQYFIPGRVSFTQIYFSRELRGDNTDTDARLVLRQLQSSSEPAKESVSFGDRSMLPPNYKLVSIQELKNIFGSTFGEETIGITHEGWQGPFHSVYGSHLINITQVVPAHLANLEEVRSKVRQDWLADRRQQQDEQFYQQLRDRYTVVVDSNALSESMETNQ